MITKSALHHIPKSQMAYAYDKDTLHIRMRSAIGEVKKVTLWIGDPYKWEDGGLGGNLEGGNVNSIWTGGERHEMILEGQIELFDCWFCEFTPPHKRARYGFILEDMTGNERLFFGEKHIEVIKNSTDETKVLMNLGNLFCFPFLNQIDVLTVPNWVKTTVWYQIFPERFANGRPNISPKNVEPWGSTPTGSNFMGGDIFGIIDNLDYLIDLGITGIYLCPIFTASANHKYDTIDYYNIDPHFGGNEALKLLVEKAHKHGIKIMLDAVFNHSGANFPKWLDVVKNGEQSIYKDWFWINRFPVHLNDLEEEIDYWNLPYETFSNVANMPKLNTENPECKAFLLDVATYWIKEFDIDGWRLDVANEIDHQFWRDFRKCVKAIKPDCYILGEIWHDGNPWVRGDQYDALMNYPLATAINAFISHRTITAKQFMQDLDQARINYPRQANEVMFNLLDSHDTDRLLSLCNGNKHSAKLAYLLLFLQPGSPCIYYGGEIGLDGKKQGSIEGARKCMQWDIQKQGIDLKNYIKRLIELRKIEPDLHLHELTWLDIGNDDNCIGLQKGSTLILINNSLTDKIFHLSNHLTGQHQELITNKPYQLESTTTIPGLCGCIFKI
ncbi:glycoside hydrolase family 13 protein [Thorsellia anophelis]|uniref:Glycosidase n=1 Tax=Thorsellia anophelis DSM 18579 TaxID=1123402 RepID=A0A1I0B5L5_9GAMM|nr:glycoside hydrolase family 13 protein [Thorsellia anophelis]SET01404.1 Glycosidase [Thorsellia anophelis DSM 18579]